MKKISSYLAKIIELLQDGEFHDGTSIGKQLNITRTSVWKIIKKLISYGIAIDSIKSKGYALREPLILLDVAKLKKLINTKTILLTLFEQINSTNEYLKNFPKDSKIQVCLAETQTQGKGRLQRHWHSPFGKNIYLSLLYPFNSDISELAGLSLIIGLSICKTIESLYALPQPALVKWPNDVICDNKKLAGTLIEVQAESHGLCYVIIGIGLNVNMLDADDSGINQSWTSLRKLTMQYQDRNIIVAKLINYILEDIKQFQHHGLVAFFEDWKNRDALHNKIISLKSANHKYKGKILGINPQGHLLMQLENGASMHFSSGDTSIIK